MANPLKRPSATPAQSSARSATARATDRSGSPSQSLDSLVHHRLRLGILSALAGTDSMTFNEIKSLLKTTDGNLSVHARKLETANYLACTKSFEKRKPVTRYELTLDGRRALQRYVDHIEALVLVTRQSLEK